MQVKLLLFGILAEKAGFEERLVEGVSNLQSLHSYLAESANQIQKLTYSIAVNGVIEHGDFALSGGEEIALLPPFSGG